jgi:hypothetical protein
MKVPVEVIQGIIAGIDALFKAKSVSDAQRRVLNEAKKIAAGKLIDAMADAKLKALKR